MNDSREWFGSFVAFLGSQPDGLYITLRDEENVVNSAKRNPEIIYFFVDPLNELEDKIGPVDPGFAGRNIVP